MLIMREKRGFTLIELLIVLVILGILAAIALPNYSNYVMRSRRGEGVTTLNNISMEQAKFRSNNAAYGDLNSVYGGVTSSENGHYALSVTNASATGFTVTAAAQNGQTADTAQGTSCATLTLQVNGLSTTRAPAACWAQ